MTEAPADLGTGGQLEQKILQVLRKAGAPVRTPLLVKECQVPKRELNRVLYRMRNESKVSLLAPVTWRLGGDDPGSLVPTQPARPSMEERIYRFLEASGPCKALRIAKALGMETAKDVNPDLYKMGRSRLLSCDEKSKEWKVSGAEDSGRGNQPAIIIYKQNPINMIYQNQISIANSEAIQIGHGNVIVRQGENGAATLRCLPPVLPGDSPAQGLPAGAWGPQDIHIERSMLQRVEVGHGNEMTLLSAPSQGPDHNLSSSPAVSPTAAATDASFEVQMPEPGPHPQGATGQRIRIKSCCLKDVAIGNGNKMTVIPGAAARGGPGGPGDDGGRDPEEQQEVKGPPSAVTASGSFPPEASQALPAVTLPTQELNTMTLKNPEAAEDRL